MAKLSQKSVFITGGSGFIGSHLIERLLDNGYELRCLLRYPAKFAQFGEKTIRKISGDLDDISSLEEGTKGSGCVIHLAALINGREKDIFRTNVDGTKNLLSASVKNGVKRFIFISSTEALVRESPYGRSKHEGEEVIRSSRINWTIIRPTIVYGPGDNKHIGRLMNLIKYFPIIPMPGYGHFYLQPLYIDDLVLIIRNVLERDDLNTREYTLAGPEDLSLRNMVREISECLGVRRVILPLPELLVRSVGELLKLYQRLGSGTKAPIYYMLSNKRDRIYEVSDAIKDLSFSPRTFSQGICATLSSRG